MKYLRWFLLASVGAVVFAIAYCVYPHGIGDVPIFRLPTALSFAGVALLVRRRNWYFVAVAYLGCVLGIMFLARPLADQFIVPRWGAAFDNEFVTPASGAVLGWLIAIVVLRLILAIGRKLPPLRPRPLAGAEIPTAVP